MSDQQQSGDPLGVLPARVRQYVYLGYAAAGCVGTASVALGASPTVLVVIGAFSPLVGGVAASNVRPRRRS